MKAIVLYSTLLLCCITRIGSSQENSFSKHELQMTLGVTYNQDVVIEPMYTFMFTKYLGISSGVTLLNETYGRNTISNETTVPRWRIDDEKLKTHLFLRTNFVFRIPILKQEEQNMLFFTLEPGLFMNLAYRKGLSIEYTDHHVLDEERYKQVKTPSKLWFYYNLRPSLSIDLDFFWLGIGYTLSNCDLNDDIRGTKIGHAILGDYLQKKRITGILEAHIIFRL